MQRVRRFTRYRVQSALYPEVRPVAVSAWTVGGEPVPFDEAIGQAFEPVPIGAAWGKPWDTVWFDVRGEVPGDWAPEDAELVVDLGFSGDQPGFQAEATAYRPAGTGVKAIEPFTAWVRSDAHTSELQSLMRISYDVFCMQQ